MSKDQPISLAAKKDGPPEKYEIENAADTLMRAEQIKGDKRLMPHVHKHLHEKKKQVIKSIDDLKKRSHDRRMELMEDKDAEAEEGEGEEKKKLMMSDPSPHSSVRETKVGHK